jgi:hypothetical protein
VSTRLACQTFTVAGRAGAYGDRSWLARDIELNQFSISLKNVFVKDQLQNQDLCHPPLFLIKGIG